MTSRPARQYCARGVAAAAMLCLTVFAGLLYCRPALAGYGAVAYDQGARKIGTAWDQDSQRAANEAALRECGSDGCSVRFNIAPAMCGAIATPDKGGAWGGSVRKTLDAAKFAAMKNCQKNAKAQCTARESQCNK
jgi:hypothetical protein